MVVPHGSSVYFYHFVVTRTNSPFAEFLMMHPTAEEVVPMVSPMLLNEPVPTTAEGDAEGFDIDRIVWLRACLTELQRATAEGVPVRGWFHWSLMDNVEWILGFEPKFGLFRTDMTTLERTPKLSARWFREMARCNAVA